MCIEARGISYVVNTMKQSHLLFCQCDQIVAWDNAYVVLIFVSSIYLHINWHEITKPRLFFPLCFVVDTFMLEVFWIMDSSKPKMKTINWFWLALFADQIILVPPFFYYQPNSFHNFLNFLLTHHHRAPFRFESFQFTLLSAWIQWRLFISQFRRMSMCFYLNVN